jgi:hypothetical protein
LFQSPIGHPNQIHKANEGQALHVVSQSLQIVQKIYRNLSCSCHHSQMAPIEDNWCHFFIYAIKCANFETGALFAYDYEAHPTANTTSNLLSESKINFQNYKPIDYL